MGKRGHGEGSIRRRNNGKWLAQVTIDGHRLSKTHDTRKEAQEWVYETTGQIKRGLTYKGANTTFGEFMEEWLRSIRSSVKQRTWSYYNTVTSTHIMAALGDIKFKDLKPAHIQALYHSMEDSGVGIHVIRKAHTILHSALQHATVQGYTVRNPASATIPPAEPEKEMRILDESQVSQLLIVTKDSRLGALLHVAVATGMRQMELLGLQWTDIDWLKKTLTVQRQLKRGRALDVQYTKPKTAHGMRLLALGESTIMVLQEHYNRQQLERQFAGDKWQENNLVFPTSRGTPWNPRNLRRDFEKALQAAGLPQIRFHDLRHTAASLMLNHGIPVIVVSRRLGHSRPSITMDVYGHLIPGLQQQAADKIDELITPVEIELDEYSEQE
jgi:integrase